MHSGSCRKISREEAKDALKSLKENKLDEIFLCPETMGKVNQLGNLEEVLELCKISEKLIPCLDFGHLKTGTFINLIREIDKDESHLKLLIKIILKIKNKLKMDKLLF